MYQVGDIVRVIMVDNYNRKTRPWLEVGQYLLVTQPVSSMGYLYAGTGVSNKAAIFSPDEIEKVGHID